MAETVQRLELEYCPPLDAALVAAISSDFDLSNPLQVSQLHEILEPLKAEAVAQNHDDAISGTDAFENHNLVPESTADGKSTSYESDEVISGFSNSRVDSKTTSESDGSSSEQLLAYERLSLAEKEQVLAELFPNVTRHTIKFRLRKLAGNFSRVVDELLHESFLIEEEQSTGIKLIARGVEGFSADDSLESGQKKGRKKHRNERRAAQKSNSNPAPSPDTQKSYENSVWRSGKEDVDFICSKTSLSQGRVSSVYHANGASFSTTLKALIEQEVQEPSAVAPELVIEQFAQELSGDFPKLPFGFPAALIRLAYPSTSSAHELAAKYLSSLGPKQSTGGIQIIPVLPPVDLGDSRPLLKASSGNTMTIQNATQVTQLNSVARNTAFSQAATSYRKANSKNHMGGAAAYYSELGRDHNDRVKFLSSAAADAVVDSQSTPTKLDLHGVSVKDAVRIARERTLIWWNNTKDARLDGKRGAAGTYHIVTGVGHHSQGGRGKIGPAVGRMLLQEGWKVSIDSGSLDVSGMSKPRNT